ncbi:MAG TPA: hypothetical protein VJT71_15855, partial [Pyrinomonadaceae bacterium]|nr:hypothetical protein [Pyrinomonadaceae bacterium]
MSSAAIAENVSASPPASLSVPLRNLFFTITLTFLTLAVAGLLAREQGYEMAIVTMGWPHIILGFIFYFGRVIRGETRAREAFAMLALATLAIWIVHYNFAITGLIYLYFLYHAFRDEIFVFLQTRARHRRSAPIYAIAGVGPAILLMLLVPQQKFFRSDLRRTEFKGSQVAAADDWTLISFKPVPNSGGRDFYFFLEAPRTAGLRAFVTEATRADSTNSGEVLVGDRKWPQASDLIFRPHYLNESSTNPGLEKGDVPVLLTGGHRVGQTFKAERNDLDGLWLRIGRAEDAGEATQFIFHLASPPLLPHPAWLENVRLFLVVLLALVVLWKLILRPKQNTQLWICIAVLVAGLFGLQTILKGSNNAGYAFPLIFQFVVVFHYWSWYVFSFDKQHALKNSAPTSPVTALSPYDRMLAWLRPARNFWTVTLLLNLVSGLGVFWYYRLNGPA